VGQLSRNKRNLRIFLEMQLEDKAQLEVVTRENLLEFHKKSPLRRPSIYGKMILNYAVTLQSPVISARTDLFKVKISLYQAMEVHRFVRRRRSHIF
jgi:hypothetical protein